MREFIMAKKKLTFKEAQRTGQLKRFAEENPSKADGDVFDKILSSMTKSKKKAKTLAMSKLRRN